MKSTEKYEQLNKGESQRKIIKIRAKNNKKKTSFPAKIYFIQIFKS